MTTRRNLCWFLIFSLCLVLTQQRAEARRKHRRRRHHRYTGPPPTHPVVLWARTLSDSTDVEQRKIAAFKLSQYSQPIYQTNVISTLSHCMDDADVQIKVLCTKAMGRAGTQSMSDNIRETLLDKYKSDSMLRSTIIRVFIARRDDSSRVQDALLAAAKKKPSQEELLALLSYFELFGTGTDGFVQTLVQIYDANENGKVKRAVVKALGERARGQDSVVELLSQCSGNKDTPLALTCLSGLQLQAKKDIRAWAAVQKSIQSDDPDVLMATLDVINALPEMPNSQIARRLVEIIGEIDDSEIQEKAVLALGNCGDRNSNIVETLLKLLKDGKNDESTRIAAALVLGKQSADFPERAKAELTQCSNDNTSQSLRMACQLGMKEFAARKMAEPTVVTEVPEKKIPIPATNSSPSGEIKAANNSPSPSGSESRSLSNQNPTGSVTPSQTATPSPSPKAQITVAPQKKP